MLPVVMSNQTMPAFAPEQNDLFKNLFNSMFSGMSSGLRRIRVGRLAFELIDGQSKTEVPPDQMMCVFLGAAHAPHCVWYEKAYAAGQEPEAPDLLWYFPTGTEFPEALPSEFRKKVIRNGRERWAFSIRRRTVWAMLRPDPMSRQIFIDLDKPYIFDLGSMSVFGRGGETSGAVRWSGIKALCDRFTTPQFQCLPMMFPIQFVMHPTEPQGVILFKPAMQGDVPAFFDNDTILRIYERSQAADVQQLLSITEKLTWDGAVTPEAPRPASAPVEPVYQEPVHAPAEPVAPVVPVAPVAPVVPAPAQTATTAPLEEDLLAQAANVLSGMVNSQQEPKGSTPAQEVTPASAVQSTVDALKSLLG